MGSGSTLFQNQNAKVPHLVQSDGGLSGEVKDLRADLDVELGKLVPITNDEYTNAATAVTNAIKTAIASVAAPVTYSGAQLNGAVGANALPIPRNITVTTAGVTPADAPATATINGLYRGKVQTETITVSQTAATAVGVKPFSKVTSIVLPAADGTAATLAFGFGAGLGLSHIPKVRAGGVRPVQETMDGTAPTAGAITANGLYTPNTAPDGVHDYNVMYEFDPALL